MNRANIARLLLVACFLVLMFNGGARFAIGLLLRPMTEELEWSRSTLSLSVMLFMLLSASALPLVGRLVDRAGAGVVLGWAVAISAAGLAAMSLVHHVGEALFFYGVVFALGSAGMSITPVGVLLARWYPHRVGMANSIAISGMGVGQLLVVSVLAAWLGALGWRGAFLALGVATLVCVLPPVLAAGRAARTERPPEPPAGGGGARFSALLASKRLWLLLVIYAICGFQDFLVATHIVAYARDEGVGALLAGNMLAFMGLTGLAGVLLTGLLNDRFGPILPTAICFLLRVLLFLLLLASREPWAIVTAALVYGVTFWITAPLTVVFAREIAGPALLGALTGFITMIHHMAGGFGALAGASVFDLYGSYMGAFVGMLVLSAIALALTLALPRGAQAETAPDGRQP